MRGRCQARSLIPGFTGRTHACPFAAKERHRLDSGETWSLCRQHLKVLVQSHAPEVLLERWRSAG